MPSLKALALVCSLKTSDAASSSEMLAQQVLEAMADHDVACEVVRVADHDIKAGVELDVGGGDEWPALRAKVLESDIVLLATPTWLGQHSSVCQRVLERLDAELSEKDDQGRLLTYGKVAVSAVVGNEDGAHHISGILYQALNDVGFSIPAGGVTYWNGEAMHSVDYKDLGRVPDAVASTTRTAATNAVHLARLLRDHPYPPSS